MAPGVLERLLGVLQCDTVPCAEESRVLAGRARNEDAAVLRIPVGKAIVQTVDILTPIVSDPFHFGRIAAANALSDVYALGGEPWCAMNIVCFPSACEGEEGERALGDILRGGLDALREAGAVLVGGHTVEDQEIKYGLSVTGVIDPDIVATNDGLVPGDTLVLTKPLGTGVLSTGIKARWEGWEESEKLLRRWCGKLNKGGAAVIRALRLRAATDITGFGLGGHLLEMALASGVVVKIEARALPLLPRAEEYARNGLIPTGSHGNRRYWQEYVSVGPGVSQTLESLVFDVQTSGGLVLAVPAPLVDEAIRLLREQEDEAWIIGHVTDGSEAALVLA